jgi:hypothetical protein
VGCPPPCQAATLCVGCKLPHVEGTACSNCGFVRSRIMARAGPTPSNLHFVAEDASTLAPDKFTGHLLLASILRRQVFHDEMEMPEALFEKSDEDMQWRHVFAQSAWRGGGLVCCAARCGQLARNRRRFFAAPRG